MRLVSSHRISFSLFLSPTLTHPLPSRLVNSNVHRIYDQCRHRHSHALYAVVGFYICFLLYRCVRTRHLSSLYAFKWCCLVSSVWTWTGMKWEKLINISSFRSFGFLFMSNANACSTITFQSQPLGSIWMCLGMDWSMRGRHTVLDETRRGCFFCISNAHTHTTLSKHKRKYCTIIPVAL